MDRQTYAFMVMGGDTTIFKLEKQCIVCEESLGKGLMASKKQHCNFCHHAVCGDCSPQKVSHSNFSKPKRICTLCYQLGVEKHYSDGYSQELQKSLQKNNQLLEQISREFMATQQAEGWCAELENKTKKWKEEYKLKREGNQNRLEAAKRANNDLARQIAKLKGTLEYEVHRLSGRNEELQRLRDEIEALKKVPDPNDQVKFLKIELSDLQDENIRLAKNLENISKAEGRDDKLVALHLDLKEKIREVESENKQLNSQIQNYEPEEETEGTDALLLNEMCQRNQVKIQQLRTALDKNPKPVLGQFDGFEAVTRNKCKCLIF